MPYRPGDHVTVHATDTDPYILQFQKFAVVSRRDGDDYYVMLDATMPPNQEFGPFPPDQLVSGWKDGNCG